MRLKKHTRKKARGSKLNCNPPSSCNTPSLTYGQQKAVAIAYSLGGRLVRDLLAKFVVMFPDGRVDPEYVRHGQFVANVVCTWANRYLHSAGLSWTRVTLTTTLTTGPSWGDVTGAEITLEFPKEFGHILVEQCLKDFVPEEHKVDYDDLEVFRNMVTTEVRHVAESRRKK
jgi:hypothetical protein